MAKGYIGNAGSKAYPLGKGWVGIMPPQAGTVEEVELPSGYRQLNYIESSGTQYIDTGFKHNQDSRIVAQLQQPIAPGTQSWLISARNSSSSASRALVYDPSRKWRVDYNASSTTGTKYPEAEATDMIYFDFNKNVLTFNGESYQWDALTFQCNYNLVLFARNTAGTIDAFASYRLYACKIYDNAVLVRDFIPCKNASNVAGLYDLINGQFYGSAGAEEFIAGDIVSSIPVAYPLKAGWMGDANGKARKVFGAAGYIWQKYAVTTTGQIYQEVAGESTTADVIYPFNELYVGSTYTLDSNTGQFTVNQSTEIAFSSSGANNAVGKYYIETNTSGTVSGSTVNLITAATYSRYNLKLTITPYTAELTTIQAKGDLLGTVTAEDITTYPLNGIADDGYWYVLQGIPELTYSGSYSYSVAVMGGQNYLLLEITGSGTYSSTQATTADIWICGGGGGGKDGSNRSGGGGGYTAQADNQSFTSLSVSIGSGGLDASGGETSVSGGVSLSVNGGESNTSSSSNAGGSGGGGASVSGGKGQGTTTYLFADSTLNLYCGGGGAGGLNDYEAYNFLIGGDGGSNGGDGTGRQYTSGSSTSHVAGGDGGDGGGGDGGSSFNNGAAATAYGSGGGGGGKTVYDTGSTYSQDGGAGYQGVCFIRIPLN